MLVLGIDPGSEKSAYVLWNTASETAEEHDIVANEALLASMQADHFRPDVIGIEHLRGFGQKAGNEVYDTCEWVGRFDMAGRTQSGIFRPLLLSRKEIVTHLCESSRAGDKDVRDAIIYRFGGKDKAIGVKKNPGVLYGIAHDEWSALAVCLYIADMKTEKIATVI